MGIITESGKYVGIKGSLENGKNQLHGLGPKWPTDLFHFNLSVCRLVIKLISVCSIKF
jgi:hypothetical protein